ncbi:ATP-binding protein [Burkholderia theae]|uniref:ATP-binding protein n=1 Tax=Burkholderia theae TaxID=3143496 RepID=UPI003AFA4584
MTRVHAASSSEGAVPVNPLLEVLPLPVRYEDLPMLLNREPLLSVRMNDMPLADRERYASKVTAHFVPTPVAIDIADAILASIWAGYEDRNPATKTFLSERMQVAKMDPLKGLSMQLGHVRNARGLTIKGITGLGKSTIVNRVLSLLPQVIEHGRNQQCGWASQLQLVWIKVDMTSDGSRHGFLMQIYAAVDAALGTDYFRQYSAKKWTVETHMVVVAQLLFNSFCGVLIVEEIQLRNFQSEASRNLMLLFFLRLCNLGIPIVLIGNPIGFEGFEDFSQDVRRMSSGGAFELWPATSSSDVEWVEFVVPGMLRFNILPKPPQLVDAAELLFGFTGGICDFLAKLLIQAQLLALRSGKDHLSNDEVVAAFRSPVMRSSHALIRGLVERDVNALSKFLDVPALSFASMWDSEIDPMKPVKAGSSSLSAAASAKMALTQGADIASKGGRARSSAKAPRFVTAAATFQAKKTSAERRKRKAEELRASLSPEDVRADGRQNVLLGNFHELKKRKGS